MPATSKWEPAKSLLTSRAWEKILLFFQSAVELAEFGKQFQNRLADVKRNHAVPDYGWYPYESLAALPVICELLADEFAEIAALLRCEPLADIGCGDGDLAMLFAHLGVDTDAIDHAESNFNQMRGVQVLKRSLETAEIRFDYFDIDLDKCFELPRTQYGLILFLGTLYHLKNPYYVLEALAGRTAYCILSTRIAQVTRRGGLYIESEPLAYLLDPREANNDPTNFWIFSEAGLLRLLTRSGWVVRKQKKMGRLEQSNPIEPEADQRIFLLLKSRRRFPDLHVRIISGLHALEQDAWRWTMKRFSLEVALPGDRQVKEFALRFAVPEVLHSVSPIVKMACFISGEQVGAITCDSPGTLEFRGRFPRDTLESSVLTLDFQVESSFAPLDDQRELGVIIPLEDGRCEATERLPFRIS